MKQSVSTKIPPLGVRKTSAPKIGKPVIPNQKVNKINNENDYLL
jgi:hypothetical protein